MNEMTRTKTSKESLESIGFEIIEDFNTLMRKKLLGIDKRDTKN